MEKDTIIGSNCLQATLNALHYTNKENCLWSEEDANGHKMFYEKRKTSGIRGKAKWKNNLDCKLRSNGMPVPLLRNCYSIFNGTKYR